MKKMRVAIWLMIGMCGIVISFIGGLFGGIPGAMIAGVGAVMAFYPTMIMFNIAKLKRFLPLFIPLEDGEKYVHFPDTFGKLHTIITKIKHKGVLYIKGWGFIDDKGTEYGWGKDPVSFAEPTAGYTYDVNAAQYTFLLKAEDQIDGYDEAIKAYLGEKGYKTFCEKFRKNQKPDIYDINAEIDYLLDIEPKKALDKLVFAQTYSFKHFLLFLKYNYHPQALDNAINTEKILIKQEMAGYKDPTNAMAYAKAALMVLFGIMILLAVLSTLDLSSLGDFLGMGI